MLLENKNAIIYGGGGSIGGAGAREFAREGAKVFLAGRTREKLDAVAKDIETSGGAGPVQHLDDGVWVEERGGDWNSFVFFSDSDGNGWVLQERPADG